MSNENFFTKNGRGLALCLVLAVPSWILGKLAPVIGGPVIAILLGMIVTLFFKEKKSFEPGIKFTSKKILQWAVVLLGFGLDLTVVLDTGKQSLPIIICTIAVSLIIAFLLHKAMKIPSNISTLVGVGSSICGGSAIAATAPVIDADDEEVAQAISVIFFYNVLAAVIFPVMGSFIGFDTGSGEAFGIFAGTAVNDTSSVTAAASTWDSMWGLGTATLDKAVTVKLTRTLAIIPITLVLALMKGRKAKAAGGAANGVSGEAAGETTGETTGGGKVSLKKIFPFFILYFIAASLITTVTVMAGADASVFAPVKDLSKFFIILAMAAIGLNTDIVKLVKTGGKPLALGACCWLGITGTSLVIQHLMGLW